MTESNPLKDWELEQSAEGNEQWQLLDTEQELAPSLQLTPDHSAPVQNWQPVEYDEGESPSRGGWILPAFIIVAMVAVIGYIVWLGLGGFNIPPTASQLPAEDPVSEPSVLLVETPAVEEPTATPLPPRTDTPAPEPTATATPVLIEQKMATINSQYGLNARSQPNLEGDPVTLLEDQSVYRVLQEAGEWLQIALDDGTAVWIAAEFVTLQSEMVPAPPGAVPTPEPAAEEPAPVENLLTTGVTPPEPFTDVIPDGPAVLIQADAGVNARTEPGADSDILLTVPQGAALAADALSTDEAWIRVLLPNDAQGWMFLDAVETAGDIDSLTAPSAQADVDASIGVTETVALTETVASTETVPAVTTIATVFIDNLVGANVRVAPETTADVVEFLGGGTEWPATGRTANGDWIRIELADGRVAWVFSGTIRLNVDESELDVVTP